MKDTYNADLIQANLRTSVSSFKLRVEVVETTTYLLEMLWRELHTQYSQLDIPIFYAVHNLERDVV